MGGGDHECEYSEQQHHHYHHHSHIHQEDGYKEGLNEGTPPYDSGHMAPNYYDQAPSEGPPLVKIFCEARPDYYLTVRSEGVILARGDDCDIHQQWIKDHKWSTRVKDEAGFSAFCLINRATGLALWHGQEMNERVSLQRYDPHALDESILWTQSADVGNGYQCIRPVGNIHLNLDANHGDYKSGGVKDGTDLILFKWKKQENQKWKIMPICPGEGLVPYTPHYGHHQMHHSHNITVQGQEVKLHCEARDNFYLSARSDGVVLAPVDDSDIRQLWIKDDSWGNRIKDEAGFPAFALINKATQMALRHGSADFDLVDLTSYDSSDYNESVLWTLSADVGRGYRCLRPVGNIHLNLDADHGDLKHGGVHDGTNLILYKWTKRENQKWNIVVKS